jgi:alkaline phosphatase
VCPGCKWSQDCWCNYDRWYAKSQGYDPTKMWTSFYYAKESDNYLAFTDSAAAATAINTGKKTTRGRMGMMWNEIPLPGIAEIADVLGKSTGVVSSAQLSHATPGAV